VILLHLPYKIVSNTQRVNIKTDFIFFIMEDKKKLENNQIEAVSGGTFVLNPNKPYCFKCKSQHVRTEVLRTSPDDPTTRMMTCCDCGNFWYTTDRNGKK